MRYIDEHSNAPSWELEVTCKNTQYLRAVVKAILKYGFIEFDVRVVDGDRNGHDQDGNWNSRYTVLMWSGWFHNLKDISKDLSKIENKFEELS